MQPSNFLSSTSHPLRLSCLGYMDVVNAAAEKDTVSLGSRMLSLSSVSHEIGADLLHDFTADSESVRHSQLSRARQNLVWSVKNGIMLDRHSFQLLYRDHPFHDVWKELARNSLLPHVGSANRPCAWRCSTPNIRGTTRYGHIPGHHTNATKDHHYLQRSGASQTTMCANVLSTNSTIKNRIDRQSSISPLSTPITLILPSGRAYNVLLSSRTWLIATFAFIPGPGNTHSSPPWCTCFPDRARPYLYLCPRLCACIRPYDWAEAASVEVQPSTSRKTSSLWWSRAVQGCSTWRRAFPSVPPADEGSVF
ncbi:hypothetical protein V8E55_001529 [Tylopilus felleus]